MKTCKMFEELDERCKFIFNIIQQYGPVTKSEISAITQIKLTTLNRDMEVMVSKKIVIETSTAESTGGRKPALYDVNPHDFYIIGMDISRTYTEIVIANLKFEVIAEKRMDDSYVLEKAIEILPSSINELMRKFKIHNSMLIGIGIGIFMGLDSNTLYAELIEKFEVPVYMDNGANAAVIGEYYWGLGKFNQNIAYINCGVGIRTGVISSGVLIRSINNSEDALGHMIIDNDGELCECGNRGCVETYASISRITQTFINEIEKEGKRILNKDLNEINYMDVCRLAENNDKVAKRILMNAALHFGTGLSNFIRLLNPQLIILSGPLVQHSQLFYDECKKIALEKSHNINNGISFNKGGYFKNNSIAVGASIMVIREITQSV